MRTFSILTLLLLFIACSDDMDSEMPDDNGNVPEEPQPDPDGGDGDGDGSTTFTIWDGDTITFSKTDSGDPSQAENQDAISESVVISRGNNGGEIYNVVSEGSAVKGVSPEGTRWAEGSLDNIANLSFSSFRDAVGSPKNVVGKDLVLHIEAEDVYLYVKFTGWGQGKNGSFSYERSTEN